MSYVFDIYREMQKPVRNIIDYSIFVCFFPLLVAGPIERANHLLPQIISKRKFNFVQSVQGCKLILWGLFKKVVIADNLALVVDNVFLNYHDMTVNSILLGFIGFSFQIYCDFSGYSDIAIGTAKLFGFELLSNFKFPYFSRDIAEFWRRWHISLSTWFRDYLYIPLGGSKEGKFKAIRNTFIIFLLSGFWHGSKWTFIFWGLIHALAFIPLLILNKNRIYTKEVVAYNSIFPTSKEFLKIISTFTIVTIAWVFFRADSILIAFDMFTTLFNKCFNNIGQIFLITKEMKILFYIVPFILLDWYFRRDERDLKGINYFIYVFFGILIWFYFGKNSSFIYFQF
jgi:alginate O-acetyltransferase complex protein AlgI